MRFLHHFRILMIKNNRFGKYLLYAIGEIILVVIGILIALQVNNWNQNRQLQIEEKGYLKDIKANLQEDLEVANTVLEFNTKKRAVFDSLSYYIDSRLDRNKMIEYLVDISNFNTQDYFNTLEKWNEQFT